MNTKSPTLYFVTEEDGFFGQLRNPWESMNVDEVLAHVAHVAQVERVTWMQLANGEVQPEGATILHSSSQQPEYKQLIDDVLLDLLERGNRLVPSIHATRSHENKGYQELHKRRLGVLSLPATYFSKLGELDFASVEYPCVLKSVSGFGSVGVRLLRSENELVEAARPIVRRPVGELLRHCRSTVAYLIRKHLLRRGNLRPFGDYYLPHQRFVLQEFVPGLQCDYKVLAFGSRLYCARRGVRPNDFRASGSGIISYVAPPDDLLDYASHLLETFGEPCMSFDIASNGESYHLIEFQALHFGPLVLYESPCYYRQMNGRWEAVDESVSLERAVGEAMATFLSNTR